MRKSVLEKTPTEILLSLPCSDGAHLHLAVQWEIYMSIVACLVHRSVMIFRNTDHPYLKKSAPYIFMCRAELRGMLCQQNGQKRDALFGRILDVKIRVKGDYNEINSSTNFIHRLVWVFTEGVGHHFQHFYVFSNKNFMRELTSFQFVWL
jgi:hypothetical protein